jgi:hypothetical protein
VKGVVRSISAEELVVDVGGHSRTLRLGDKLAGGATDRGGRPNRLE